MRILLALVAFGAYGLAVIGCTPALAPRPDSLRQAYDAALVERGARLAAVGGCHGCHTTREGASFAGGVPMRSPYGTVYSTNITPDAQTGIGGWSEEAFRRALREGVRPDGERLYPAFPYDRYSLVTDEDAHALYAFLMTRKPVRAKAPRNELVFPFNIRSTLAVWQAMYLRKPTPAFTPTDALTARGAYLVEGLGHCGSCHSPRNAMYAEQRDRAYEGGDEEGWHAYAIERHNKAPMPWDVDSLAFYLTHGWHSEHGIARGTMGPVTAELRHAAPEDVRAMAAYVVEMMGRTSGPHIAKKGQAPGAEHDLYETACIPCHNGEALPFEGLPLPLSLAVHGESPRNLINVILHGLGPAGGATSPIMPGYAGALDEDQVVELVAWLRANLTDEPPWPEIRKLVRESAKMPREALLIPPGGAGTDPLEAKAP